MKSLFEKYIWLQLILSILLLFGGALIVVFAIIGESGVLESGLNIICAVILFLFGLFAIIASFAFEPDRIFTNGIVYGSASIALGVFLCLRELILLQFLVYLLATFFIVIGAIELIKAIALIAQKHDKKGIIVLTFIIAIVLIAGGIMALIFKEEVRLAFCIIAGALLALLGVYLMVTGIKEMAKQAKGKKKPQPAKGKEKKKSTPKEEIKEIDYSGNKEKENQIVEVEPMPINNKE